MADKSIQFSLTERNLLGKDGKRHKMQVAVPTGRKRIGFRSFCARVAKSTTFNEQEVAAVLNYATGIAKDIVSEGDIVEFGDLGTLSPTFKSKAVPLNEKFRAQEHILAPAVRLTPSKKYFTLMNVTFEQIKSKKENTENPPSDTGPAPSLLLKIEKKLIVLKVFSVESDAEILAHKPVRYEMAYVAFCPTSLIGKWNL